jgi:hypothetical protein
VTVEKVGRPAIEVTRVTIAEAGREVGIKEFRAIAAVTR